MKTTKFLLAGLLTGAMALGVGCKTDTMARGNTEQTPSAPDTGIGGTGGMDVPQSMPPSDGTLSPNGDTGTREREPDVHHNPPMDGTGGSGQLPDSDGLERPDGLGGQQLDDPMIPNSSDAPINNGGMMNNGTGLPQP